MTKMEKIKKIIEKYNGYLITSLVCKEDISKTYVAKYINQRRTVYGTGKYYKGI